MKRVVVPLALLLICLAGLALAFEPRARASAAGAASGAQRLFWNVVDPPQTPATLRADLIDERNALAIGGGRTGEEIVVAFVDYNCGACRMLMRQFDTLRSNGRNLKIVFRNTPHDADSVQLALAVLAARRQGKAEALQRVFAESRLNRRYGAGDLPALARASGLDLERLRLDMATVQVRTELKNDQALAWKLRVTGSPSMVLDDRLYRGWRTADMIGLMLDGRSSGEITERERGIMTKMLKASITPAVRKPPEDSCSTACEASSSFPLR